MLIVLTRELHSISQPPKIQPTAFPISLAIKNSVVFLLFEAYLSAGMPQVITFFRFLPANCLPANFTTLDGEAFRAWGRTRHNSPLPSPPHPPSRSKGPLLPPPWQPLILAMVPPPLWPNYQPQSTITILFSNRFFFSDAHPMEPFSRHFAVRFLQFLQLFWWKYYFLKVSCLLCRFRQCCWWWCLNVCRWGKFARSWSSEMKTDWLSFRQQWTRQTSLSSLSPCLPVLLLFLFCSFFSAFFFCALSFSFFLVCLATLLFM